MIEIAQEKAADSVLLFEIVQSYVAGEVKKGVPLADIPALKVLPAFMNSMQRALTSLISIMPKDGTLANAELERIQKVINDHDKDTE